MPELSIRAGVESNGTTCYIATKTEAAGPHHSKQIQERKLIASETRYTMRLFYRKQSWSKIMYVYALLYMDMFSDVRVSVLVVSVVLQDCYLPFSGF